MFKWVLRLFLIGIVGFLGIAAFQSYQKGYFSIPDMPEGAYVISTRSGFRGIVLDAKVSDPIVDMHKFFRRLNLANPDRRYLSIPFDVAPWFKDVWSICNSPLEREREELQNSMPAELKKTLRNARLDAVCRFDVDGEEVLRGMIFSVPNL